MMVVRLELWPRGDESKKREIGRIEIANDGTGTLKCGNYDVRAHHAGKYYGKRKGYFKRGTVRSFNRMLSPYRLLSRALRAIMEV